MVQGREPGQRVRIWLPEALEAQVVRDEEGAHPEAVSAAGQKEPSPEHSDPVSSHELAHAVERSLVLTGRTHAHGGEWRHSPAVRRALTWCHTVS